MKHFLIISAIAIAMSGNFSASGQTAPTPATDKYGFYSVTNCPTSLPFIKAATEEQEDGSYNVNIYRGRQLAQTINCETTSGDLYYFDANFDGNIDILVGPAASRNFSIILLWDDEKGQFVAGEDYINGNLLVNPTKKFIVGQGAGSYCSEYYTRYIWHGKQLVPIETLIEINDPTAYAEYGVKCRFTLVVSDNFDNIEANKTYEANKISKLPEEWRTIINAYGVR